MLPLAETVNAWSAVWLDRLVAVLWQSTLLAGLVGVAALLLRRAAPAVRYWLWQLVALKLLLMPFWAIAVPVPEYVPQPQRALLVVAHPTLHALPAQPEAEEGEAAPASAEPEPTRSELGRLTWPSWLLLGWVAVVLAQAGRLAWQRRRLGQLLRRAAPCADSGLLALVATLASQLGLRRTPRVVLTDVECSPFVCGPWRPVLVLPCGLLGALDPAQRRQVLLHELAHVRRGDVLWGWFPEVARRLYFFHPIAHWVAVRVRLERELACDQVAMTVSGSDAAAYAETLLQVVTYVSAPAALRTAVPATAIAEGAGPQLSTLWRRRMTMLPFVGKGARAPSRRALGTVAVLVFCAVALPTPRPVAAAPQAPAPGQEATADRRLRELEARLQAALRDVEALRRQQREAGDRRRAEQGWRAARDAYCARCHGLTSTFQSFHAVGEGKFEAVGNGAAVADYDGDGWLDLFVVDSPHCPAAKPCRQPEKVPVTWKIQFLDRLFKVADVEAAPELNLSRKSYQLPKAKAEALAAFLRDHVKAPVIEPKVEGDTLSVTTTPEVQKAIGRLIGLIRKDTAK
jgi:beta-lactamase regulating signal transducer with metallopeptidase domain